MSSCNPDVAREILAYMVQHPDATDTLEGIADWWLLERRIQEGVAEVRTALDELSKRGLVVRRRGRDVSVLYQVNRSRLSEIESLLAEDEHQLGILREHS